MLKRKPIGRKNYGRIPHLPGSRLGPSDKMCNPGHARIATDKARDKHDEIYAQEKLDGSNCGVARVGDTLHPIGRAGYLAISSRYKQHRLFAKWVYENRARFMAVLRCGERLVGEWMLQAHGTRYNLPHEPFVVFDLMTDAVRMPYDELADRVEQQCFQMPYLIHRGVPLGVEMMMEWLGEHGRHGAIDPVEGIVLRAERDVKLPGVKDRKRCVDFLVKYVRPDKEDGKYLESVSGEGPVWNNYLGVI